LITLLSFYEYNDWVVGILVKKCIMHFVHCGFVKINFHVVHGHTPFFIGRCGQHAEPGVKDVILREDEDSRDP